MSTPQALDSHSIGYLLKRAQHALRLGMDEALRAQGLTTPQYAVLSVIEQLPGISNAHLARLSFVTPQTMHGIIANLEKRGWIKRVACPQHGRKLRTQLTAQGRRLLHEAQQSVEEIEAIMTHKIAKKDLALVQKTLLQCIEHLAG